MSLTPIDCLHLHQIVEADIFKHVRIVPDTDSFDTDDAIMIPAEPVHYAPVFNAVRRCMSCGAVLGPAEVHQDENGTLGFAPFPGSTPVTAATLLHSTFAATILLAAKVLMQSLSDESSSYVEQAVGSSLRSALVGTEQLQQQLGIDKSGLTELLFLIAQIS